MRRLLDEELLVRLVRGKHAANPGALVARVVIEEACGRVVDLAAGLGDCLPLLRYDEVCQLLLPGTYPISYRPQEWPALDAALAAPIPLGLLGGLECLLDMAGSGTSAMVDLSAGVITGRVSGRYPGAVYIHRWLPAESAQDIHDRSFQ